MAVSALREDYLGRDLITPATNSMDPIGRLTTTTADYLGRPLKRTLRVNSTAYTLNTELSFAGGNKFTVTTAGTTAAAEPGSPAVNATVADGTATLTRTK